MQKKLMKLGVWQMLTKEKLSEITENAIEDLHYTYVVAKVS